MVYDRGEDTGMLSQIQSEPGGKDAWLVKDHRWDVITFGKTEP